MTPIHPIFIQICTPSNLQEYRRAKQCMMIDHRFGPIQYFLLQMSQVKQPEQALRQQAAQQQRRKKRSSSSRSRSQESRRSRSKSSKKHKNKHKEQKLKKKRSRSRSKDQKRNKNYRDDRDRDRDRRDYRDADRYRKDRDRYQNREKDREKEKKVDQPFPTEVPMPLQVPMPPIPGERRKRERSRSPLNYYRRNQNTNEGQFWDSFSWVPRMNYTPTVSAGALANTKKMRRLMITNLPYEIGITEEDLRNLITRFMAQNYLKDEMNSCPVMNMEINEADRNVAVELSSVEQTCRICKLEKIELFKGNVSHIIRLGDSCYGNNVVTQAQTAAQAQAAAFAAINVLENKKTNFSVDTLKVGPNNSSTLIRVANAVTVYMAGQLNKQQWAEYEEDLIEGFSQFGKIVHHWFVKKDEKEICADPGNLFIEYESKEEAEKAMAEMQGRIYDERSITLYYIPRDLYYQNFKKNLTPPPVPAPKK